MNKVLALPIAILLLAGCAHNKSTYAPIDRHYVVIDVEITDLKKFDEFFALETLLLKKYNSNVAMDIRGKDQKKRYIILSFPDRETTDNFVKSKEFQNIIPLARESAKSKLFHGSQYRN